MLVETVVSLVLLAAIAVTCGSVVISAARSDARSRQRVTAANLADDRVELLRSSPAIVKAGNGSAGSPVSRTDSCQPTQAFQTVYCQRGSGLYTVTAAPIGTATNNVYTVTVTVSWTSRAAAQSLASQTLVWAP